jgi:hypothetical protein
MVKDVKDDVVTYVADTVVQLENSYTLFDTTGGEINVGLPASTFLRGTTFVVYLDTYGAGNSLVITPDTTELIGGSNDPFILNVEGQHATITSLGNGRWIVN